MPTAAEVRRRKKQDATRDRVAVWLSPDEAALLDQYVRDRELSSRAAAVRELLKDAKR